MKPNNVYASATSLLINLQTNLSPAWSVDSFADFVVFQLDLTGATVMAAFGYGTTSGFEQSHALAYIESEAAAVVPFLHKSS